jgi:hypothetical protein
LPLPKINNLVAVWWQNGGVMNKIRHSLTGSEWNRVGVGHRAFEAVSRRYGYRIERNDDGKKNKCRKRNTYDYQKELFLF